MAGDPESAAMDWLMEWVMSVDDDARKHYYHIIDGDPTACGCKYEDQT